MKLLGARSADLWSGSVSAQVILYIAIGSCLWFFAGFRSGKRAIVMKNHRSAPRAERSHWQCISIGSSYVPKRSLAFGTLMRLLLWRRRNVRRIVVEIAMALEQLLLSKWLETVVALIRLLVGVNEHVALQMACRYGCIRTQVAFVTLLAFVSLAMQFIAISAIA